MIQNASLFFLLSLAGILSACLQQPAQPKILVFTKTAGFVHSSIPVGTRAIVELGKRNGFEVDTTSSAQIFTDKNLRQYKALVFLNTTDTADALFTEPQKKALQNYIRSGGGFAGVHAATDAGYRWDWYTQLVGANFLSHPRQQKARIVVVDHDHLSTRHLPDSWVRKDEWYNFKNLNPHVNVLLQLDESSYEGGENGAHHPVSWYHEFEGGRAWYTALGHTEESYEEPEFLQHLLGGIQYAMGTAKP